MAAPTAPPCLARARVAFTGKLASMTRRAAGRLVERAGGRQSSTVSRRTTLLVVGMDGWPLLRDGAVSGKLQRAEQINRRGGSIRVVSEEEFLELAGLQTRRVDLRKTYPAEQICGLIGIEPAVLRRWEMLGLVRSQDGLYDFQDIVSLRTVAGLVAAGARPEVVARSVRSLAAVLPGTDRPLAQLTIVAEHPGSLIAEIGGSRIDPAGQLRLNFDCPPVGGDDAPAVAGRARGAEPSADDWFERAQLHEEQEQLDEASAGYRAALAAQPHFPEAHFNLGNVLRVQGRHDAAEERYRIALEQDPELIEAWYNLADLQEHGGRIDEAIESLGRAVRIDPAYADAHYNLAVCLEAAGRQELARRHWHAYLALDPQSEWAEVARGKVRGK